MPGPQKLAAIRAPSRTSASASAAVETLSRTCYLLSRHIVVRYCSDQAIHLYPDTGTDGTEKFSMIIPQIWPVRYRDPFPQPGSDRQAILIVITFGFSLRIGDGSRGIPPLGSPKGEKEVLNVASAVGTAVLRRASIISTKHY